MEKKPAKKKVAKKTTSAAKSRVTKDRTTKGRAAKRAREATPPPGHPTNAEELLAHLRKHPRVYCQHLISGQSGWRTYVGGHERIEFVQDDGRVLSVPLGEAPQFKLEFREKCFFVRVGSGSEIRYWYAQHVRIGIEAKAGDDPLTLDVPIQEVVALGVDAGLVQDAPDPILFTIADPGSALTQAVDKWAVSTGRRQLLVVVGEDVGVVDMYEPRAVPRPLLEGLDDFESPPGPQPPNTRAGRGNRLSEVRAAVAKAKAEDTGGASRRKEGRRPITPRMNGEDAEE